MHLRNNVCIAAEADPESGHSDELLGDHCMHFGSMDAKQQPHPTPIFSWFRSWISVQDHQGFGSPLTIAAGLNSAPTPQAAIAVPRRVRIPAPSH